MLHKSFLKIRCLKYPGINPQGKKIYILCNCSASMKISGETVGELLLKNENLPRFLQGFAYISIGVLFSGIVYNSAGLSPAFAFSAVLSAGIILIGAHTINRSKIIKIRLSREKDCLFSILSMFSKQERAIPASSIKGIRLDQIIYTKRGRGYSWNGAIYSLGFILDSGEELAFEFGDFSTKFFDLTVMEGINEKIREEAMRVAEFLGVPYSERILDSRSDFKERREQFRKMDSLRQEEE